MKLTLPAILSLLMLSACSSNPKSADDPGPSPAPVFAETTDQAAAAELYQKARGLLQRNQFETAVREFENLEATHPFSDYAAQATLDISYAYYRLKEYDSSTSAADRFLKLYPQNEKADYAYYLKGLSNFSRGKSVTERLVPRKLHLMDQSLLRLAFDEFSTLVTRFPDSEYADDSQARMRLLRTEMARHELSTAEYYFERSAMVAVINRVNTMLETYPDSSLSADGLALMARAYLALGNRSLAAETVQELEIRNPEHPDLRIFNSIRS